MVGVAAAVVAVTIMTFYLKRKRDQFAQSDAQSQSVAQPLSAGTASHAQALRRQRSYPKLGPPSTIAPAMRASAQVLEMA